MQTTTISKPMRVEPRPTLTDKARRSAPTPKPNSSALSREELQRAVREMIG